RVTFAYAECNQSCLTDFSPVPKFGMHEDMILRSISSVAKLTTQWRIESAVRRDLFVGPGPITRSKLRRSDMETSRRFMPLLTELNRLRGEFCYKHVSP